MVILGFYADVGHEIVPMQVTPAEHWVRGRIETLLSVCKFTTIILLVLPSVRAITAQVSATGRSSSSRVPIWYVPPADTELKFATRIIAIRVRGPTLKILDAVLSALNNVELDSVRALDDTSKLLFYEVSDSSSFFQVVFHWFCPKMNWLSNMPPVKPSGNTQTVT